ncbi:hypothetical protein [Halorhabdus salina]|uniref:hypothetical protein n=1 Tax=Halorhabdus salina TaxID=2750670 RepID=UPI0015EE7C98|nr:hypothetical protein [Halorhabdus salina]
MLGEIQHFLDTLGAPSWLLFLLPVLYGLYHFRHLIQAGRLLGSWLRTAAVAIAVSAILLSGAVPGIARPEYLNLGATISWLSGLIEALLSFIPYL